MVMNIGALKEGEIALVQDHIASVVSAVRGAAHVKVILENCLLVPEQIAGACEICVAAGAHFVKTSTGFAAGGAVADDVRLMRRVVGERLGVMAAGGIRDRETALGMIAAGADRLGCSAGVVIVS